MRSASPARQRFASRLVAEVALAAAAWRDPRPFDTVYFGGGTPSQLPPEDLARVLDACRAHLAFVPAPEPWIFLEANPEDVTPEACAAWRGLGVRTLSLGVQSFSDEALRFLGRRHTGRPGAGRGRDRARRGLPHGVDRSHVRPARADRRGVAARAGDGRFPGAAPPLVLSADDPPAHAVRGGTEARPVLGASRGRPGDPVRADPPVPRRRRLAGVRGLELRARRGSPVAAQPEVLGPHPVSRSRTVRALARADGRVGARPALVERARHAAMGETARGG